MTFIDDETRKRLEFICKTEGRKMSNMLAFLINDYYNRLEIEKHKINPKKKKSYTVFASEIFRAWR
jgi:hypothetical protein